MTKRKEIEEFIYAEKTKNLKEFEESLEQQKKDILAKLNNHIDFLS